MPWQVVGETAEEKEKLSILESLTEFPVPLEQEDLNFHSALSTKKYVTISE